MKAIIETAAGRVQGYHTGRCLFFGGIPYAASPAGAGRFRPPRSPEPWTGVRAAVYPGPVVPQNLTRLDPFLGPDPQMQSEDSLSLNVWTPAADGAKRPVYVWIHGGAYVSGSGSFPLYDCANLSANGDIVCVSINYRLGERGYLYLGHLDPDYESSGNSAVLDQIAALEWVRDNIDRFGGDPARVTVGGQSAGAGSITALMMAAPARGLFQAGIVQSIAHMSFRDAALAVENAETFMRFAGAQDIRALEALPIEAVLAAQRQTQRSRPPWLKAGFQPRFGDALLPKDILPAARDGDMPTIPILLGTTSDEWNPFSFFMNPDSIPHAEADAVRLLDEIIGDGETPYRLYAATYADRNPRELFEAAVGHWRWWAPNLRFADALADKQPVYFYEFAWESPTHDGQLRAGHCVDLPFCFRNLHTPSTPYLIGDAAPEALARAMHDAWIAFIRTGDPSTAALGDWPRYDTGVRPTMIFDLESGLTGDPNAELRAYWETARREVGR